MKNINKNIHISAIAIFSVTFIVLFIIYGICYTPDSYGYMDMSISREPLYPLFLAALRAIFGTKIYTTIVVILQMILAVYAIFAFCKNITNRFSIKGIYIVSVYILLYAYYFMALPLYIVIKLDSPLVTMPLAILTEGIAYSLYLLYAKSLILAGCDKDYKNWFIAMVYACTMSLTRAGLMPTIIAAVIVGIYISVTDKNKIKRTLIVISTGLLAFIFIFALENIYFKATKGRFMTHTYGPVTTLSNIIYTADETDKDEFEDESLREIFTKTYEAMKENGWTYNSKPRLNLIERGRHIEECHDNIKFRAFGEAMAEQYKKLGITDEIEWAFYGDKVAGGINKILIKKHIGRWLEGYVSLCIWGYIRTVAYAPQSFVMRLFTGIITIIFLLGLFLYRKNKDITTYLLIVLLSILGIVMSTSLVIMCMTRYMVYNFALFYTGIIIMWSNRKKIITSLDSKTLDAVKDKGTL